MKVLHWLDNMKLPVKMATIGVLALIGLALPTYYYVTLSNASQEASQYQLKGIPSSGKTIMAMKVMAGTITSSPGPRPRQAKVRWRALVPEFTAMACCRPHQLA